MQSRTYLPREQYPLRNKIVSWAAALPASFVAFFGAFFIGAFMPWMVVFGGLFGLDAVMRNTLLHNLQADMHLHPMELAYHPLRFAAKRAAAFLLRMGTLWFLGPIIFLGSILASSGYMLRNISHYRSSGLIVLSTFPGFLLTSLWWGTWWLFMAPVLFLGLGIIEATWVGAKYFQLWGFTQAGVPYVPTAQLKQRSRNWLESLRQLWRSVFGAASETARDVRDTAAAGARAVKDTALAGAKNIRDSAGAPLAREQGYRAEPGELDRKLRSRSQPKQQKWVSQQQQQQQFAPSNTVNEGAAGTGIAKMEAMPQQYGSNVPVQSPFSLNPSVVSSPDVIPVDVLSVKDSTLNPNINQAQRARGE